MCTWRSLTRTIYPHNKSPLVRHPRYLARIPWATRSLRWLKLPQTFREELSLGYESSAAFGEIPCGCQETGSKFAEDERHGHYCVRILWNPTAEESGDEIHHDQLIESDEEAFHFVWLFGSECQSCLVALSDLGEPPVWQTTRWFVNWRQKLKGMWHIYYSA